MKKYFKIGLFGLLTWLTSFIVSWFFYSKEGQPVIDLIIIKTIMIVLFSILGAVLLILCFKGIHKNYLGEGIGVGIVWLVINWILDLVVLVPMAKMAIGIYFAHIGLRYLMIPTMSISMGYLLQNKERREG